MHPIMWEKNTDGPQNIGKKRGFTAVFTDIIRRNAYPEIWTNQDWFLG